MDKLAFSYDRAINRLAIYGLSNRQSRAAMAQCPKASTYDGEAYYYLDDVDAMAEAYIDGLGIDDCGGV